MHCGLPATHLENGFVDSVHRVGLLEEFPFRTLLVIVGMIASKLFDLLAPTIPRRSFDEGLAGPNDFISDALPILLLPFPVRFLLHSHCPRTGLMEAHTVEYGAHWDTSFDSPMQGASEQFS